MFEPPSPLSTTLPDFSSDDVHEEAPEDPMSPRKPPVVPSFLSVDSSDAEKARAYANLALALNSTIPTILENQEIQQGMILAYSGKVDLLNGKVDAVHELITKTLAAEAKAVARGRTIASMPSIPPPPEVLELDEEPTNHGQHATVKITSLDSARAQFSQVEADKRAALAAVKILQDEREENNRKLRERYTAWGIAAVPVIMVLFWAFEHLVFKAN